MNNETFGKAQLQRGYYNNDWRAVVIPILPNETYKEISGKTDMLVDTTHWFFTAYPLFHSKNKPREDWEIKRMKLKVLYEMAEGYVHSIRGYRSMKDYKQADRWRDKLNKLGFVYDVVKDDWYRL
jgi:hypothetical protein|nr:MAG TPA: Cysteinyl-tRNA synthetase [Caudoviricetes sp.]